MIGYIGQNREHSRLYPSSAIGQEDGQSEVIIRKVEKSTVQLADEFDDERNYPDDPYDCEE